MPDGGFVVSYSEITDRRQAEEALHDSEARIRLFANAMPTMMCYIDEQERYQFVNRAYRAAFARDGGKIVGRKMRAILGEAEYDFRRSYIERALAGSTSVFDVGLPSADGEPRFGLATYVPHRSASRPGGGLLHPDPGHHRAPPHPAHAGDGEGGPGAPGLRAHRQPAGAERDPGARDRGKAPHRARAALRQGGGGARQRQQDPVPGRRQPRPAAAARTPRACSSPRSRAASCRAAPPTMSRRSTARWSTSRTSSTSCSTSPRWNPAG